MTETVDVVVIGLGPGGEEVGSQLAKAGLSVVGVESRLVGGECPYYACVPTKMMIRAASALAEARRVGALAGSARVDAQWAPVAARIRADATDDWNDQVAVDRFTSAGGTFVRGRGRISGPGTVEVSTSDGERTFHARRAIVLNPGTDPAVPPITGLVDAPLWTNREAVQATELPASMIVLGGGPVGCEFAQVFARFGSAVTLVQAAPRLLPANEPEAGELIASLFEHEGIRVLTSASASGAHYDGAFHLEVGGQTLTADQLVVAAGRTVDLAALGVDAVGLPTDTRTVSVDARMRAADGVWAIGDVVGHGAFTHMSMYQAGIAVADILGSGERDAEYHAVPHVTFTDPEVGGVGLTEAAAREKGLSVRTATTQIPSSSRGYIHKIGNEGFVKLVQDAESGVLVGATSVGPCGGEVLGALTVAVHARLTTDRLAQMIFAYPTFHRAISSALADLH